MTRTIWQVSILMGTLLLLVGGAQAQQQRGTAQTSQEQTAQTSEETADQASMMQHMQGIMQHMQSMMQHMQGRMGHEGRMERRGREGRMERRERDGRMERRGREERMERRGRGGMMGHRGMGADDDEDEREEVFGSLRGHGGMMGHGRLLERMAEQLELTDEQQAQVRALHRDHMREAIRMRADLAISHIEVQTLLDAEPVNLAQVQELLQTMASQEAALHFAHITLIQDVKKLLTAAQQQKFRSMRHGMMGDHHGMMERHGMMGRGAIMKHGGMRGHGQR